MSNSVDIDGDWSWHKPFAYSQGMIVENLVYVSGQASVDGSGQVVGAGDFEVQARQVFANLQRVLDQAGSGLDKVFKVTVYMTDMSCFPHLVDCRKRYFQPPYPVDTTVEVGSLALPGLMLEIDAIARLA